jgi:hypothetical protein
MWDLLVVVPMAVGALMIGVLLLELGLGKIGFLTKTLGIEYDQEQKRFELSTGPVFGVFIIGAALVLAPIVIDEFLVNKKTFLLSGTVGLEDGKSPVGISVISCYPLTDVLPDGSFYKVPVYKDEKGEFPLVAFEMQGYETKAREISAPETVDKLGSKLELKEKVVLLKKPN